MMKINMKEKEDYINEGDDENDMYEGDGKNIDERDEQKKQMKEMRRSVWMKDKSVDIGDEYG